MIYFKIPCSPELEKEVNKEIKKNTSKKAKPPLEKKRSLLNASEKIRFQILDRQFTHGYFPGLPSSVDVAHRLYRIFKKANLIEKSV